MKRILIIWSLWMMLCVQQILASPTLRFSDSPSWLLSLKQEPAAVDLDDISWGYYYELLDKQVHLGTQEKYLKEVRVLIDEKGIENGGHISIYFEPSYQTLIIHELFITRDGVRLDKRKASSFNVIASETDLSRFLYNGTYSAYCILDDLRKGDKITFSYTLKGFNPVFKNKFADSYYLQGYEPIGLQHIHYFVPNGRELSVKAFNGASSLNRGVKKEGVSHFLETAGTEKGEYYSFEPNWSTSLQWFEVSEFSTWAEVGKWAAEVNPIQPLRSGSKLKLMVDELWNQSSKDSEKFARLVIDFVQNEIRYMGVMVGEHTHRANSPEKIFDQRYGDCKDKSVLLVSMLQAHAVDASLVLVNSLQDQELDLRLPSPFSFDHMIVKVKLPNKHVFIDPTITNQGGSLNERFIPAYGQYLDLALPDKINHMAVQNPGKIQIRETYQLQPNGSALLKVESIYTRGHADRIRQFFKSNAKNQIERNYLEFYQKLYADLKKESGLSYTDKIESNVFVVRESYTIEKIYETDPSNKAEYISLFSNHLNEYLPTVTSKRPAPISLTFPLSLKHDVFIVNASGKTIDIGPFSTDYDETSYVFEESISSHLDTLKIQYFLNFKNSIVSVEDVDTYVDQFHDRNAALFNLVYIDSQKGQIHTDQFDGGGGGFNYWMIFYLIILFSGFAVFCFLYLKTKPFLLIPHAELVVNPAGTGIFVNLLGVTLVIRFVLIIIEVSSGEIFENSVWNAHLIFENLNSTAWKLVVLFEGFAIVLSIGGTILSFFLLVKKRDIFAQTFLIYIVSTTLLLIFDEFLVAAMIETNQPEYANIIKSVFYMVLWGGFVMFSKEIKQTFNKAYSSDL